MNRPPRKKKRSFNPPSGYIEQIEKMRAQARAWIEANPSASPKVQFNHPPKVQFVATIGDAIKHHFVTCDDEGSALLRAMCEGFSGAEEPTSLMCEVALECV